MAGRPRKNAARPLELRPRGFNAGYPVLSADQVREIRARRAAGVSFYRMARDYQVHDRAISDICHGRIHKGVM